jgi:hypothetical protein
VHENDLRDQLAGRLDMLEPGFQLVATNHPLPNAHGTRGFVDILARDRHGATVVIELKRSNSTAREALHEVAKYVELLNREQGLPASSLRAMIVSTQWSELLAPFSRLVSTWSHSLHGVRLALNEDETRIVRAEPVMPLPAARERGLTPEHHLFFFRSPGQRDAAWMELLQRAAEVAGDDLIGVDFDHAVPASVPGPYLLYLALGRVDPEDVRTALLHRYASYIAEEDYDDRETCLRARVLAHILKDIGVPGTQETGSPEVIASLVTAPLWHRGQLRRSGIFLRQQQLRSDEELLAELAGWAGLSQTSFAGSASPAIASHWQGFLQHLQRCLVGNDAWSRVVPAWLAEVAEDLPDSDVRIGVFNPCDLLAALLGGWPDRVDRLLPHLTAEVTVNGRLCRSLHGMLSWDGQPRRDPVGLIRLIYPDALVWSATRLFGETWQTDRDLLALLDFDYLAFEVNGGDRPHRLKLGRGRIKRMPATTTPSGDFHWPSHRPIQGFLQRHFDEIDALVRQYREIM